MSFPTPGGCTNLRSLSGKQFQTVNVMGIVLDLLPPTQSRGTDWCMTFTIQDPHLAKDYSGRMGIKCRFFRKSLDALPPVESNGDVVLLRQVKISNFRGADMLLSTNTSQCIVFPAQTMGSNTASSTGSPFRSTPKSSPPLPQETAFAVILSDAMKDFVQPTPASSLYKHPSGTASSGMSSTATTTSSSSSSALQSIPPPNSTRPRPGGKFRLLSEVHEGLFCDLTLQVIKIFHAMGGHVELYGTDYTSHSSLFNYEHPNRSSAGDGEGEADEEFLQGGRDGDAYGYLQAPEAKRWPGPFGKRSIRVDIMPPHADAAREGLKEGDLVSLRNVRVKMGRSGTLEGNIWADKYRPDEARFSKVKAKENVQARELLVRSDAYWAKCGVPKPAEKRKSSDLATVAGDEEGGEDAKQESKGQRKRRKQKEKRERDEAAAKIQKLAAKEAKAEAEKIVMNQNVRCKNDDQPIVSLAQILDDPIPNLDKLSKKLLRAEPFKRARVHVVDFEPQDLKDFARLTDDQGADDPSNDLPTDSEADSIDWPATQEEAKWEWSFHLTLQDAVPKSQRNEKTRRLKVQVAGKDADFLLNLDAADLNKDRKTFAKLREKLFTLWGDLEERKRDGSYQPDPTRVSGKAFECCIQEYGIVSGTPAAGAQNPSHRLYRMFDTTVK